MKLKEFLKAKQELVPRGFGKETINAASYKISSNSYFGIFFFAKDKCSINCGDLYSFSDLVIIPQTGDMTDELKPIIQKSIDEFREVFNDEVNVIDKVKRIVFSIGFYTDNSAYEIGNEILAEVYPYTNAEILSDGVERVFNSNLYEINVELVFQTPIDKYLAKEMFMPQIPSLYTDCVYDLNFIGLNNFSVTLDKLHSLQVIARHY